MSFSGAIRSLFIEVGIVDKVTLKMKEINAAFTESGNRAKEQAKQVNLSGDAMRNTFLGVGAALGVGGAFGLGYLKEGTRDLAQYQDAYAAFSQNVKGNSASLVASLQQASNGLIDEGDMLAQANKALMMGVSEDKLSKMMLASRALSRATGEDLTSVWTAMTSGTARQSPKMLEAIGIQMSAVTEAEKQWAKSQGISYAAMTDEQKSLVFTNYVLAHSDELLKKVDLSQDSLNDTLIKSNRAWAELRQEIAEGALPIIRTTVTGLTWIVNGLRAIPGPAKTVIAVAGVLAVGAALLGSFVLLNVVGFWMLKKQMLEATGAATMWGAAQIMLAKVSGILAGGTTILSGALEGLAASEYIALWPLIPLVAAGYLLWDLFNKGWDNSLLGKGINYFNEKWPYLAAGIHVIAVALQSLWSWIMKIPDTLSAAWSSVSQNPLFRIAAAAMSMTPIGMTVTGAWATRDISRYALPTARQLVASSSSSQTIRGGDTHISMTNEIHTQNLDEKQVSSLFSKAAKQAAAQNQRDFYRDVMGATQQ